MGFVACLSGMQTAALCCCLWAVRLYRSFTHYLINHTIFWEKKVLNMECVFWFPVQSLFDTFFLWEYIYIFFLWLCDPKRVMASSFLRFLDHTQRRTAVGRTALDEWSARHRDLYLTTHNTHNRQTSKLPVGFEPTISAGERPQTYALDRAMRIFQRHVIHHKYTWVFV